MKFILVISLMLWFNSCTNSPNSSKNNPIESDFTSQELQSFKALDSTTTCGQTQYISASNPCILINGRVDTQDHQINFNWPGTDFRLKFSGTQITIYLSASDIYFDAYIDGVKVPPKQIQAQLPLEYQASFKTTKNTHQYPIAQNLKPGIHTLRLVKRNETIFKTAQLLGFQLDSTATLLPTLKPKLKIEFIGDSYVVGYGNLSPSKAHNSDHLIQDESSRKCTDPELDQYTNSHYNYATQVADQLNAQYQINAISGLGIARHYNGNTYFKPFQHYYQQKLISQGKLSKATKYIFEWKPSIVVLALGTNDLSTPISKEEQSLYPTREEFYKTFQIQYELFLEEIRQKYPDIPILLIGNNLWPNDEHRTQMKYLVEMQNKKGRTDLHYIELDNLTGYGCAWHPDLKTHQEWSNLLVNKIKSILNLPTNTSN